MQLQTLNLTQSSAMFWFCAKFMLKLLKSLSYCSRKLVCPEIEWNFWQIHEMCNRPKMWLLQDLRVSDHVISPKF